VPGSIRFIFARRGDLLIVILAGGTKSSQSKDLAACIAGCAVESDDHEAHAAG